MIAVLSPYRFNAFSIIICFVLRSSLFCVFVFYFFIAPLVFSFLIIFPSNKMKPFYSSILSNNLSCSIAASFLLIFSLSKSSNSSCNVANSFSNNRITCFFKKIVVVDHSFLFSKFFYVYFFLHL